MLFLKTCFLKNVFAISHTFSINNYNYNTSINTKLDDNWNKEPKSVKNQLFT